MEPAGGQAALVRPSLERSPRCGIQAGELAQARGLQLRVETALPVELAAPRRDHPLAHDRRAFAGRFRGQRLQLHAAYADLEVDPVQHRSGQPSLIGVDPAWPAATPADPIPRPATGPA